MYVLVSYNRVDRKGENPATFPLFIMFIVLLQKGMHRSNKQKTDLWLEKKDIIRFVSHLCFILTTPIIMKITQKNPLPNVNYIM